MAAFYMVYTLWLRNETHFSVNRVYLLLSLVTSMGLPFVSIPSYQATAVGKGIATLGNVLLPGVTVIGNAGEGQSSITWLAAIYLVIALGLLAIVFYHIVKVFYKIRKENRSSISIPGVRVVEGDQFDVPFSFFNRVHVPKNQYTEEQLKVVLRHEMVHVQKRHSADVVFAWVVCSVWWVNPFAWMLLRAIREVHEYEADSISKGQGASPAEYIRLMLETAMPGLVPALSTGFNKPLTLKRLAMITKEKSAAMSALKYLLAVPAGLLLVFVFSTSSCSKKEEIKTPEAPASVEALVEKVIVTDTIIPDAKQESKEVFFIVEKMPSFPYHGVAGQAGFEKYISDNVKYPQEAMDKGKQGKVYVSFIVENDGTISNAKIIRAVDKVLDEEALRVVKTAPKWIPGKQRGVNVAVGYTFPIIFKLQ